LKFTLDENAVGQYLLFVLYGGAYMNQYWQNRRVLVTGRASFIGFHLVDSLFTRGVQVRVVDNRSGGLLENIKDHVDEVERRGTARTQGGELYGISRALFKFRLEDLE
jgi:nucleoside-diphosphate-sugar epimerase